MPLPVEKWGPKQCREIFDRMAKLGPDNCTLELRHVGTVTPDGKGNGCLRVVDASGKDVLAAPDVNESEWCPPIC